MLHTKYKCLGWRYRSPKSPLAIKNCSWRVKTPEEQILAIKKNVINKIADPEFHIIFGHFTLPSLQINSLQTLSPCATDHIIFDIQLTHVFAALLTRLSSCIINGYGYSSILITCCKFGRTGFPNLERFDSIGMQGALEARRSA